MEANPGSHFKPSHFNSYGKGLWLTGEVPAYLHSTTEVPLSKVTEPLNANIGLCGELTSRPCVPASAECSWDRIRIEPSIPWNNPSYFCLRSPFLNQSHGVGGQNLPQMSQEVVLQYTLLPDPHKTDSTQNHLGRTRLCLSLKIEFSFIYFLSKSHIDT